MAEPIDDLLARIPPGWDFWLGSDWDSDTGETVFEVRLLQRALGEYEHRGHYLGREIEETGKSIRSALTQAIRKAELRAAASGQHAGGGK
jgi:hypothetical protein